MKSMYIIIYLMLCTLFPACSKKRDAVSKKESNPTVRAAEAQQAATVFNLDNGMEVILVENHASPMTTVFTIVKVGSRNESAATNGAAHFLEHLLFNGTTGRSQKQLYDEMDFYGGYNNASTGLDYTSYMILMPAEYIAQGMDIQADMLFNSTLPVAKFEKERGIVIEEIGKDSDRSDYQVIKHFHKNFYAGTPYERPVLGTVSTISHLERHRVLNFYKTWYVPNNMSMMVIGDFDSREMISLVKEKYGAPGPGSLPPKEIIQLSQPKELNIETTTAIGKFPQEKKFLTLGYLLPPPSMDGFQELQLMTAFLGGNSKSGLQSVFKSRNNSDLVNNINASLSFNGDFSALRISAELPLTADENRVVEIIRKGISKMTKKAMPAAAVKAALISRAANEIFTREKLHYFGMMKAGYLAAGGYRLLRDYVEGLQRVTAAGIRNAASNHLAGKTPVVTLMLPPRESESLSTGKSSSNYSQKILENGLIIVVEENPDSPVIGVHLLARERATGEGREKWGMTEILQRTIFESGTSRHPGAAFSQAVEEIGAELKLHDNPIIPYDDYYNSPRYLYVRLKIVDSFFSQGLDLLAEIVQNARLEKTAFEEARKRTLSLSAREAESTPVVAKRLFYDNLFVTNPGFGWVLGDTTTIKRITLSELQDYYQRIYNPANLILTISGNIAAEKVMREVGKRFGGTWGKTGWLPAGSNSALREFGKTVHTIVGKKQSYIYLANKFDIQKPDLPALQVLMTLFSDRLAFQLRERQGLAYSIGASAQNYKQQRWYRIRMGTRPVNIDESIVSLKKAINDIRNTRFTAHEVKKTINLMLGRGGMRRLDRGGRAYYISMQVLEGNKPEADARQFELLKTVSVENIQRLSSQVFARDDHLIVVAE